MKPITLIAAIVGAGVIAGVVAGLLIGGLPTWLGGGRSEREEREACEAALKARIGSFTLAGSPRSMREKWPHTVTFYITSGSMGTAVCRLSRDGTMTMDAD